jgi:phage gpG-like protein
MLNIEVDTAPLSELLQQLLDRGSDLTPVMDKIGNTLEENLRHRYLLRMDPMGEKWAPWEDSTVESYPVAGKKTKEVEKYGPGHGLLLDRYGGMYGGISYQAGPDSVTVGFDQSYAMYHEFGTVNMERRGLLTADPELGQLGPGDEADVIELLNAWLAATAP